MTNYRNAHHRRLYNLLITAALLISAPVKTHAQEKTAVGGYGELHFNYTLPQGSQKTAPSLDFHRFILNVYHQWTDQWTFASELELEHNYVAGGKATGELELEQAYVQYSSRPELAFQAGVLLPAVGLINDKHEPPLFLSVERPDYNKVIIPTTWFGNGAALRGVVSEALNYSFVILEGLDDRNFKPKDGIRSGRNKGFNASLETALYNLAIDYSAIPGVTLGSSVALNQRMTDPTNTHPYSSTVLFELHGQYKTNGIWAQAEFGTISFNANDGFTPAQKAAAGFYIDGAYDIARLWDSKEASLYPFIRLSNFNSANKLREDGTVSQFMVGVSFLPIPKVAFKADYSVQETKGKDGSVKVFNFGAGYEF